MIATMMRDFPIVGSSIVLWPQSGFKGMTNMKNEKNEDKIGMTKCNPSSKNNIDHFFQ